LGWQVGVLRIDLLGYMDGIFSESPGDVVSVHNKDMNVLGLMGLGKMPVIQWTSSAIFGKTASDADTLLQKHILMKVTPMAPAFGSDHCITPGDATIDQAYADYGDLFRVIRGAWWCLRVSDPIDLAVLGEGASANALERPGSLIVVVYNSTSTSRSRPGHPHSVPTGSIQLHLSGRLPLCEKIRSDGKMPQRARTCACRAMQPGSEVVQEVNCSRDGGTDEIGLWKCQEVPTSRGGFTMLTCPILSEAKQFVPSKTDDSNWPTNCLRPRR
jgi:hypothetical protein